MLCNFRFKIIIKVLADHLAYVANMIVSLQQLGFIKGHQIESCIADASE